ncbi:MAG: UDP-N-acetylmuramate--L-alanine ligase [Alphaproteobacteria bacterium]|nr:UDP-N-acetylmuramate--L-alanine ligase [Alphaproteobacteria bacterium]
MTQTAPERLPQATQLLRTNCVHFIGIGGSGMSGIAELMHNLGYRIQGSDAHSTATTQRLATMGIRVMQGHHADHLAPADVVVISSAIPRDNPELETARAHNIPVVGRAEMLAELMRFRHCISVAGSHGKTTTTSLVASLLVEGGIDPTVVNGGIINNWGSSARLGSGDWMIVEADESDGSFVRLPSTLAVVTNIDAEHLDHYGGIETVHAAFESFLRAVPFYGTLVLCGDRPELRKLMAKIKERRIVTYGTNPQVAYRAMNIRVGADKRTRFDLRVMGADPSSSPIDVADFTTSLLGEHNVMNVLAALTVGHTLGLDLEGMRGSIDRFGGVARRFTHRGTHNEAEIYDDYGHHPTEIKAVLGSVRSVTAQRIIAIVQPHRYSRVADLFEDFCAAFDDADTVYIADIFAAGEAPIPGITQEHLIEAIREHGHRDVRHYESVAALTNEWDNQLAKDDYVVFLGAGSITGWSKEFATALADRAGKTGKTGGAGKTGKADIGATP